MTSQYEMTGRRAPRGRGGFIPCERGDAFDPCSKQHVLALAHYVEFLLSQFDDDRQPVRGTVLAHTLCGARQRGDVPVDRMLWPNLGMVELNFSIPKEFAECPQGFLAYCGPNDNVFVPLKNHVSFALESGDVDGELGKRGAGVVGNKVKNG